MSSPRPSRKSADAPRPQRKPASQTRLIIAHGDRVQAVHVKPRTLLMLGVGFALFSVLYFGSTAYLFLRDDWLGAKAGDQAQLREDYEDQISALRNQIERITSRRLVDHATVEQKVDRLLERQEALGERQDMLTRLEEAARRAGFSIPNPAPKADGPRADATPVAVPSVTLAAMSGTSKALRTIDPAEIEQISGQIDAMEGQQDAVIGTMASGVASRTDKIAAVMKRLGRKVPRPAVADDVGGPFVPLPTATEDERFEANVTALTGELDRLAVVRKAALALPWNRPIANAPISSLFGPRIDPFLGRPAMHTGIDFRAPRGYPARAVAAGTVIAAEENGGYGNMVDVDHGNGVVTRYGHLSSISVRVGDKVAAGGRIGRVGSTGRSTGPHLHYEIRIDGQAINPMRYLSAGKEIAALL